MTHLTGRAILLAKRRKAVHEALKRFVETRLLLLPEWRVED